MAASKTAQYVALYRALETDEMRREPLFRDPLAGAFLSRRLSVALKLARSRPLRGVLERFADWRAPGARSSAIGRTRYIDDVVRRTVAEGTQQLVVLGAGFDCRAHRMPELSGVRVFEVDRPETQAVKRSRITAARPDRARGNVEYVAVNFEKDDLPTSLRSAGWDDKAPSLFIWEGVTNYLTEAAVAAVLVMVGQNAAGSRIVFTYIHRGVVDGTARFEGADKLVSNVKRLGEPWTFGILPSEIERWLGGFGIALEDDLGADAYRAKYLAAGETGLTGYAFYRIAVGRVAPAQP
ncbi:MAG: SAM-dependent methyltransferase [Polyangiaceae bacterium]|nr:SAM-dependent methyltransferase [Polyangiaceae bacterium]